MQQAVTSTQQVVSLTPTASHAISSLASRVKLGQIIDVFLDWCAAAASSSSWRLNSDLIRARLSQTLGITSSDKISSSSSSLSSSELAKITADEMSSMLMNIEQLLLTKPSNVAIDPLIEPILIARNRSFFENKYGFSESDLSRVNEYREPMTTRQRRQLLQSIGFYFSFLYIYIDSVQQIFLSKLKIFKKLYQNRFGLYQK